MKNLTGLDTPVDDVFMLHNPCYNMRHENLLKVQ